MSIRALKRFVTEKYGVESRLPDTQDALFQGTAEPGNDIAWHLPVLTASRRNVARGQKVAVIGAGPAGVSCAHDLAIMGYRVTIFEATGIAGGMMFHGIPEFRLGRSIIEKEIGKILSLGVELKLNTPLRPEFGLKQLRELNYEAVFLSVGTQRGRDLKIDGSDLDGIVKAIDFLINVNHGYRMNLGKRVLVIGGGLVAFDAARMALRAGLEPDAQAVPGGAMAAAMDAARAALRAGVTDVRMVSLESFDEMPILRTASGREEFDEARREGVAFHPQRGAQRFVGKDGKVAAVELIGVTRTYDESGRFDPVYDPSISETMEADSVILAIGQQADLSFLQPGDAVQVTPQQTIRIDPVTLATTAPGVFAGGDVAFGPRNLIEAVANGKRAAWSIDEYLRRARLEPVVQLSIAGRPAPASSNTPGTRRRSGCTRRWRSPTSAMRLSSSTATASR